MPKILHWFLRLSLLNPICIRLVGAASSKKRDLYLRSIYVAILAATLLIGLLGVVASGTLSLRDLAAGSSSVFTFLAAIQLILICVLAPIFMAGAISREANPKTWDILLTTPMSPMQIVLGNLLGRLFFIVALSVGALPLMIVTQFFGGVPLDTILLTQLVAICLALIIASSAIAMSVTRTAGRKPAVGFFLITMFYLLLTFAADQWLRIPVTAGASAAWTTIFTPLNPYLVLEVLLRPSSYVVPDISAYPWPINWAVTNPVACWCWFTTTLSFIIICWSSLRVRALGEIRHSDGWLKHLFRITNQKRKLHIVTGNPIAWRERVIRHRNFSSLIGRWGFVSICSLIFIILTSLYMTNAITAHDFRNVILGLVSFELIVVTFAAISLSSSAIAKEREDGSLDLLLTTSITPKMYLGGKLRGLTIHILPMVLVPCLTMIAVGCIVLIDPNNAILMPELIGQPNFTPRPFALAAPAILSPVVIFPYIAFCIAFGLFWSMRSKGSISATVSSLVLILIVTGGLGVCLIPSGSMNHLGSFFAAMSPINVVQSTFMPTEIIPSVIGEKAEGVNTANLSLAIASLVAGVLWSLISIAMLRSMSESFVMTVRRLAGIN